MEIDRRQWIKWGDFILYAPITYFYSVLEVRLWIFTFWLTAKIETKTQRICFTPSLNVALWVWLRKLGPIRIYIHYTLKSITTETEYNSKSKLFWIELNVSTSCCHSNLMMDMNENLQYLSPAPHRQENHNSINTLAVS